MVAVRLEYRVLDVRNFASAGQLEQGLNTLAEEGWSLAAASGFFFTLSRVRREELEEPVSFPHPGRWMPVKEER
jgi:hypothetical protein